MFPMSQWDLKMWAVVAVFLNRASYLIDTMLCPWHQGMIIHIFKYSRECGWYDWTMCEIVPSCWAARVKWWRLLVHVVRMTTVGATTAGWWRVFKKLLMPQLMLHHVHCFLIKIVHFFLHKLFLVFCIKWFSVQYYLKNCSLFFCINYSLFIRCFMIQML